MKISLFFSNYLVNRKTYYSQNGFTLFFFSTDIGIGQELALSYLFFITLIFHIFGKRIKNLKIPVSFLLFVDDRLFISQKKFFANTNANCFVAIMLYFCYQISLDLQLNMRKLKISIFPDHTVYSILQHWTSVKLVALFFIIKIHNNILGLFLIENSCFDNIQISM